jgi:hypothetical protein
MNVLKLFALLALLLMCGVFAQCDGIEQPGDWDDALDGAWNETCVEYAAHIASLESAPISEIETFEPAVLKTTLVEPLPVPQLCVELRNQLADALAELAELHREIANAHTATVSV